MLELESWNQGLRLSRVDTSAVNAIINSLDPAKRDSANGMIVYQTSDSSIYYRAGGYWRKLVRAGKRRTFANTPDLPITDGSTGSTYEDGKMISGSKDVFVTYSINLTAEWSSSLLNVNASFGFATAELQVSSDGTIWITIATIELKFMTGLPSILGLSSVKLSDTKTLSGWIERGHRVRILKKGGGTWSVEPVSGQEVTME